MTESNASHEKRQIKLRQTEWQRLEQLAEETNSRPMEGPNARRISVAEMIRRIAKGDFRLVETYTNPVELTPEMEEAWERERQEWLRRREASHEESPAPRRYEQMRIPELLEAA